MIKRDNFSALNIPVPGLGVGVKLNSIEAASDESKRNFQLLINSLIANLVNSTFDTKIDFLNQNNFHISIGKEPYAEKPTYIINVDIGLFRFVYDALYVVLSNNNIFHGMGKSSGSFNIPTLEISNWATLDLAMANSENDVYFDHSRANLHNILYILCLSFIIQHEIRHIANGHIDYLSDLNLQLFFENSKNGLLSLDSQTLEMDADSCVFAGILSGILKDNQHRDALPEELQGDREVLMCCLFALQFLFYCLPSYKISRIEDIQEKSHPNASLRYFFCFTAGLAFLEEEDPSLAKLFAELHRDNFYEFINNLAEMKIVNVEKIILDHKWTSSHEGADYADKIWKNWNNWIPRLEKYAYLPLAPQHN